MRDINVLRAELIALDKPATDEVLTFSDGKPVWAPAAEGGGGFVAAATPADVAINSVSEVTVGTITVPDVQAGDQVWVYAWFTILNNSGANRDYTWDLDFESSFDINCTLLAVGAHASNERAFMVEAVLAVRSDSLAYTVQKHATVPASTASGADVADISLASPYFAPRWATTSNDLTGDVVVTLKVNSTNATATQTCRLHSLSAMIARP